MPSTSTSENITAIQLKGSAAPSNPAAGYAKLYQASADSLLHYIDDGATDRVISDSTHTHAGSANGPKLAQANTHESPDTDTGAASLHHTIGSGANQAAAGNHSHTTKQVLGGMRNAVVAAGATQYNSFFSTLGSSAEGLTRQTLPFAGTLKNFYFRTGATQPAGGSLVATVFLNGSATGITATCAAGAALGRFSDLTNTQAVAAGDEISMRFVNNDGGADSAIVRGFTVEYDVVA